MGSRLAGFLAYESVAVKDGCDTITAMKKLNIFIFQKLEK